MVDHNSSENAEYGLSEEGVLMLKRLKNWHMWQLCLQGVSTSYSGKAPFYKVPDSGGGLSPNHDDAEIIETALTIFIRSWGRPEYGKLKKHVTSSLPEAQMARNAGLSTYLYKSNIDSLLHKLKYCVDHLEQNQ